MRLITMFLLGGLIGVGSTSLLSQPVAAHSTRTSTNSTVVTGLDACPVNGPNSFVDSWRDARSSGRRHEGVDMEAVRGTPVVAVRDGAAEFKRSNLGGNAIWLTAATGERFYYAHLEAWEGESRRVSAGDVIGYVGQTGNARGDHLHFETRAADTAVNPYPLVRSACLPATESAPGLAVRRPLLR